MDEYMVCNKKKLPEVIPMEDFEQILKYTKKKKHRLAFKLGMLAGLRISEVVNLKSEDIDFERNYIFVRAGKIGIAHV